MAAASFNEAAANRCGSLGSYPWHRHVIHGFNEAAANRCGSHHVPLHPMEEAAASMRPQRIAADHPTPPIGRLVDAQASMRPQRIAADHAPRHGAVHAGAGRFNEAAANRCGSLCRYVRDDFHISFASMRPQRIAADHPGCEQDHAFWHFASMRPQRIAADHCGGGQSPFGCRPASMRPQRIAADHHHDTMPSSTLATASMRPQRIAADHPGVTRKKMLGTMLQ